MTTQFSMSIEAAGAVSRGTATAEDELVRMRQQVEDLANELLAGGRLDDYALVARLLNIAEVGK